MNKFIKFFIIWIASNLSVPFWIVGHIHLTMNIYDDIVEIITSIGMNIIVAVGLWLIRTTKRGLCILLILITVTV